MQLMHLRVHSLLGTFSRARFGRGPLLTQRWSSLSPTDLPEFRKLGLTEGLLEAVADLELKEPSSIQRAAVPQVLQGQNIALAASTGSGKTLAYLLPIVQALKIQEDMGYDRLAKRPRVLVLVPTRELATQVLSVAKHLGHYSKFSSCCIVGGGDNGQQRRALTGVQDVCVASAGRLLKHQELGHMHLSQVTHVVIDEVDTMLMQGFGPDLQKLLKPILLSPERRENVQFIVVTATMTKAVRRLLEDGDLPQMRTLEADDLHQALPNALHRMLNAAGQDKIEVLKDLVRGKHQKPTLIFCNTVASCRAVTHALREETNNNFGDMDYDSDDAEGGNGGGGGASSPVRSYHGEMPSNERVEALGDFKAGDASILVCTDLAQRGLDIQDVAKVINFDFPRNPIDYLHRAGRTARAGRKGEILSLVLKRDLPLATAIERAVARGEPLDGLTNDKRDYAPGGRLSDKEAQKKQKGRSVGERGGKQGSDARGSQKKEYPGSGRSGRERGGTQGSDARGSQKKEYPGNGSTGRRGRKKVRRS
uniref:RNA helicase n=1 Tax=Octactis speculum TaxID=3111310 RepID=A0A7S2FKV5_9STRA